MIKHVIWDNNPEENNLEDGALVLERLEDEPLGDDDHQAAAAAKMPPPRLPPASQTPSASVCGGRAAPGRGSRPLVDHWLLLRMMRLLNLLLLLFIGHGKKN